MLILLFILSSIPIANAHEDGAESLDEIFKDNAIFSQLETRLNTLRQNYLDHPTELQTNEEQQLGSLLIEAAQVEWKETIEEQIPEPLYQKSWEWLKDKANDLNPIRLGKWIWKTAQTRGPAVAITYGVSELLEQSLLVYAASHPQYSFLLGLSVLHVPDTLGIALGLSIPKARKTINIWKRHGTIFKGAKNYYRFLIKQRETLPLDWSEVVDLASIPNQAIEEEQLKFVVTNEGFADRFLSKSIRVLLNPSREAQRETSPTVSIRELKRIAKEAKINIKYLDKLKVKPQIYAAFLIREIGQDPNAASALAKTVSERNAMFPGFWENLSHQALATNEIINSGETVDLAARRLLWKYESKKSELLMMLEDQTVKSTKDDRKLIRKINQAIEGKNGLRVIASSPFKPNDKEAENQLRSMVTEIDSAFNAIETKTAQKSNVCTKNLHLHSSL